MWYNGDMKKIDVVIIGGGIAGMTAAIYVRRANKSVVVFEKNIYGGQITTTHAVENWPGEMSISGADLGKKIFDQAEELGVRFCDEEVLSVKTNNETGKKREIVVETDEGEYYASSMIIAVGAEERKLGLPNEAELTGRGISYCATCDGAFYKEKDVAVVGGGNTALNDALYLADIATKVYLVHRRDEFRGDAILVERLKERDNVEFLLENKPVEFMGEKKLTGLKVVDKDNKERVLDVAGVFMAVGKTPQTEIFREIVDLDERGYVIAGEDCHTSAEGIYVAGDCRTKEIRQLVTAASDGAVAATEACRNL